MRLENKCVLVNGAAGGLGRAIVERFVAEGAAVMCSDLNADALYKAPRTRFGSRTGTCH